MIIEQIGKNTKNTGNSLKDTGIYSTIKKYKKYRTGIYAMFVLVVSC